MLMHRVGKTIALKLKISFVNKERNDIAKVLCGGKDKRNRISHVHISIIS